MDWSVISDMEPEKIARINALARKAKTPEGLTPAETEERDALRREYLAGCRKNLEAQLASVRVVGSDGVKRPLKRKQP